ncbi:MAG: hypothetical protein KAT78_05835, partial [Flavobacteriaceae bacterium]|nr:hypothetical protein [Flavobacteriaceae bacterium]
KKLWIYPLIFGVIGAFIGLALRYAFTGSSIVSPFKNVLHAHSHVMLLGFLFNALLALVWTNFTNGIDKVSYKLYIALQLCIAIMIIAFIIQGYALYSILFSTLHLWLSYILLIRLWKRLEGNKFLIQLIKAGIVFHFISSIGPYALGPLMVMDMKESPWYQQAIFFYLHFQFLGLFFTWMLAVLLQKVTVIITKKHVVGIIVSLFFLYAHSLDYNFDHWLIQLFGGLGSVLLFLILLSFKNNFLKLENRFKILYYIIISVAIINILGSIPVVADLVVNNHFMLIAWLHFLFLGMYVPFIWVFLKQKISPYIWFLYGFTVILSEAVLVFPNELSQWFSVSTMWLLFVIYLSMFLIITTVHLNYLFSRITNK